MESTNVEAPIVTEEGGLIVREWPAADLVVVDDFRITKLAFRNRFTQAEKAALEFAALDDPSAATPSRMQSAALRAYLKDVESATFIDLSRPDLIAGVQALEVMSLLAEGRAMAILSAPIEPHERPQ